MLISFKGAQPSSRFYNCISILRYPTAARFLPFEPKFNRDIKARFIAGDEDVIEIKYLNTHGYAIHLPKGKMSADEELEFLRKKGAEIAVKLNEAKEEIIYLNADEPELSIALAEGLTLKNYQFLKYKKDRKEKANTLKSLMHLGPISKTQLSLHNATMAAVYECRDLVNEPLSFLTAPQLGKEIKRIGRKAGYKSQVLGKKKIEALKMGGLLSVNLGSVDEPTFSILEWKPKNAKNKKPIVLVGKGVVYDTGGLSLKPTPNSMDLMKSDMGGAAMMVGTMAAISKAKIPLHVIALIPATDNRPGGNAYVPGDVINMYDGTTVEVLNTDAEGRMLLADALAYAKKYDPKLVIDSATLTGAAVRAIGAYASCVMGTADESEFEALDKSGYATYERVARMPFWKEYGEEMKSDIADLKNIGGSAAGQISAGKFLEHFTDYPWIHIDIAGPAYNTSEDSYRGKYGTGYGVRLLTAFLWNKAYPSSDTTAKKSKPKTRKTSGSKRK